MKSLRVAVIGATGLVGRTMLRTLEERGFPIEELLAVASERSVGKKIAFAGGEVEVMEHSRCRPDDRFPDDRRSGTD